MQQYQRPTGKTVPIRRSSRKRTWLRLSGVVVVLLAVFGLGVGIGNGRISLGQNTLATQNADLPYQLDYSSVTELYHTLRQDYDGTLQSSQLLNGLKEGLAEATGDPYTEFFTAHEADQFNSQLNNSFSGIGAELGKDSDGNIIIVSPIKGYPADRAGLKARDIITAVNGKTTQGMSIDQAVNVIRGKKGTKVTLKVFRNRAESLTLTIVRDDIKLPSVDSKMLDGKIGYIQISTFADDTGELARRAANKLVAQHAKSIILDLRGNPGGRLDSAVSLSSLWLPEGKTILQEKRGGFLMHTYTATGSPVLKGLPTVVLIDGGSASASEITAGALKDNGAATLMGVKSYGKGSVQQIEKFADGSELKVTIARWYRPNGQNIDKKGIAPDKEVKLTDADTKAHNDRQLSAAEAFLSR